MTALLLDIRYAITLWRKRPLVSVAALLCLALGIGATTTVFSLVDGVLLKPLPYEQPERLKTVWNRFSGQGINRAPLSGPEFVDLREQITTFDQVAGYISTYFNLTGFEDPERLIGARISSGMFNMLGAHAATGRVFGAGEVKREEKVAVISHALWQRRLGSDPDVIDSSISLDQVPYTIIGVMPENFRFLNKRTDIWVPLEINPRIRRDQRGVLVIGRRTAGVSDTQAKADLAGIAARFKETFPQFYPPSTGYGLSLIPLEEIIVGNTRPLLNTLMASVLLVLLISCANIANLLLAQASTRERELALRAAIGAGRGRLVRQMLTESVVLSVLGGVLGAAVAYASITVIVRHELGRLPRLNEVAVDARVLLFALGVSVLTGVIFGIVPALKSSQIRLFAVLKEAGRSAAGRGRSGSRTTLVVAEIALALVVLTGAGLLIRSFQRLQQVDPGFRTEGVATAQFFLPLRSYFKRPQRIGFAERLRTELESNPAIGAVSVASGLPLSGGSVRGDVEVVGRDQDPDVASPQVTWRMVGAGYFETLAIPLLRGRTFTKLDHADAAPAIIIDRDMAQRLWGEEDPLGQQLQLVGAFGGDPPRTVVGVVGSAHGLTLENTDETLYVPYSQRPTPTVSVVMRTRGTAAAVSKAVRSAAHVADPDVPVARIAALSELVDASLDRRRFNRLMFSLFGGGALLLAGLGVYSVMAYAVEQRRRELGLRGALGASPEDVQRLVLGQSLRLTGIGILAGVATALLLSAWFAHTLRNLTFGIALTDALTYIAVPTALALVALVASYLPARTASRIDPMSALREE